MLFSFTKGDQFNSFQPILTLAETNKKEKSATFEVANNNIMRRYGGLVLRVAGIDIKEYNNNKSVFFNHDYNMLLGQAMWIKKVSDEKVISKWSPPDIKTEGMPEGQKKMIDFAHEIFEWVDAGQLKGASPGINIDEVYTGADAVAKYKEDFGSKPKKDIYVYIRASDMFEWSVTPIPEQRSALKMSAASDMLKKELDKCLLTNYLYNIDDLIERLDWIESKLGVETLGSKKTGTAGDGENPLSNSETSLGDVSVDNTKLISLIDKHLWRSNEKSKTT